MKRSIGEKWVLYVGKKSVGRYSFGKYAPLVCILLGIVLGVISCSTKHPLHVASTTVAFCAAVSFFERRQFYLIIEKQKRRIAALEEKVLKQNTDKSAEA